MFKLKKILNSGTNVPETLNILHGGGYDIVAGCLYFIAESTVYTTIPGDVEFIAVIALESVDKYSPKKMFKAYKVTEEMVFETEATGTMYEFGNGKCILLGSTLTNGHINAAYGDMGNQVMVLDTTRLDTHGKVDVIIMVSKL